MYIEESSGLVIHNGDKRLKMFIDMKDIIAKYKGNYMAKMRNVVGQSPLRAIGCGVIIENDKGEMLWVK